jgi:DNA-binding NarL/FixJ family response regulator
MSTGQVSVLCVDDNDLVCEAMHRKLCPPSFNFTGYTLTTEGLLDLISSRRPDLVVLDINMPGSDPVASIRQIKALRPQTRIAALSGMLDEEVIGQTIEAGVDGYISKSEPSGTIIDSLLRVAAGEFVLSPEVSRTYVSGRERPVEFW